MSTNPLVNAYASAVKPKVDPFKATNDELTKKYAAMRTQNQMAGDVARQQTSDSVDQLAGQVGGLGGAQLALKNKADRETTLGIQAANAAASSEEAGTKAQLGQQSQQFEKTLQFQKDSFVDQMKYNYQELDQNKMITFINSSIALKESGFDNPDTWMNMFKSGTFGEMFKNYGTFTGAAGTPYASLAKGANTPTTYTPSFA